MTDLQDNETISAVKNMAMQLLETKGYYPPLKGPVKLDAAYNDYLLADHVTDYLALTLSEHATDGAHPPVPSGWTPHRTMHAAETAFLLTKAADKRGIPDADSVGDRFIDAMTTSAAPEFISGIMDDFKGRYFKTSVGVAVSGGELLRAVVELKKPPQNGMAL